MTGIISTTLYGKALPVLGTAGTAEASRILGFDLQLLVQMVIQGVTALALFYILGRLLFKPVREMLDKRSGRIADEFKRIEEDTEAVAALKTEYEGKLADIHAEADKILAHARKRAIEKEDEIIKEAKEEADRVMKRAQLEINREREQAADEMRTEIIEVATLMASRFVQASLTDKEKDAMVHETLAGMGDATWNS